jgi:hypothetical protein
MSGSRACNDYISPEVLKIFNRRILLGRVHAYHFLTGLNDLGWPGEIKRRISTKMSSHGTGACF